MSSVIFRVNLDEEFKNRLKLLSVKMGVPMGDLVSRLATTTETIADLEIEYGLAPAKGKK